MKFFYLPCALAVSAAQMPTPLDAATEMLTLQIPAATASKIERTAGEI